MTRRHGNRGVGLRRTPTPPPRYAPSTLGGRGCQCRFGSEFRRPSLGGHEHMFLAHWRGEATRIEVLAGADPFDFGGRPLPSSGPVDPENVALDGQDRSDETRHGYEPSQQHWPALYREGNDRNDGGDANIGIAIPIGSRLEGEQPYRGKRQGGDGPEDHKDADGDVLMDQSRQEREYTAGNEKSNACRPVELSPA